MTKVKPRQRDKTLKEMREEHKSSLHAIRKSQVNIKAAEGSGGLDLGGTFTPSDEQLEKINQFTRRSVGAEDVIAFDLMSCNDMYDRDDERFTTSCVEGFAALEPPYSFVGKSYMADHDYQMAKVRGRIFDVGTADVDGVKFLTNSVYTPNTEQYKDFIENIDFGLAWAVSVGVMLDKASCSVSWCGAQVYSSRFFGSWCAEGHEKGYHYTEDAEDDGWGFLTPCDPDTPNSEKARVDLDDPIDGYEISQVFLGAQYMAELAKKPDFKGMLKAASARSVPIIGLRSKEANELPIPHEHDKVVEARNKYKVETNAEGEPTWTDESGLVWTFSYDTDEVLCLGRSAANDPNDDTEGDANGSQQELEDRRPEVPVGDDEPGSEAGTGDGPEGDPDDSVGSAGSGEPDSVGSPEGLEGEDEEVQKQTVIAAAKAAGLPFTVLEGLVDAEGSGLDALLKTLSEQHTAHTKTIEELTPKAAMGEEYLKSLRADAVHWYAVAHQDPAANKGVNTERYEKLLTAAGDNVDILKMMIDEQKELAQAKFPAAVRRATFPENVNEPDPPTDVSAAAEGRSKKTIDRIHK